MGVALVLWENGPELVRRLYVTVETAPSATILTTRE
jgi:hypothetical protein